MKKPIFFFILCLCALGFSIKSQAQITGPSSVCTGTFVVLTDATSGGTWSSSDVTVAIIGSSTGYAMGVAVGTATISYNAAGSISTTIITINQSPSAISALAPLCIGSTGTLTDTTSGGVWSSSNTSVVSVDDTGAITALSAGGATISYTAGGCAATRAVSVNDTVHTFGCNNAGVGDTITLSTSTTFGPAFSSNSSVAAVVGGSEIAGVSPGTATIFFSSPAGCTGSFNITVTPTALISQITGLATMCPGYTDTISDATPGGTWTSSAPATATISGTGVISALTGGGSIISYSVSGATCTGLAFVHPLPTPITGPSGVCAGDSITLNSHASQLNGDIYFGGRYSISDTTIAKVVPVEAPEEQAYVIGVSAGAVTVTYSNLEAPGCFVTGTVTVNASPSPITGPEFFRCPGGGITTYSDTATGGTWTSSNTAVATIDPVAGTLTSSSFGFTTITYTLSTGCAVTASVTDALPTVIMTGTDPICTGDTSTLHWLPGATWSSSNTSVAIIDSNTGLVTSVFPGTTSITRSFGPSCSVASTFTVNPVPVAITGPMTVCADSMITLSDVGTGTWSSGATSVATIDPATGSVTGVAGGTTTISYSLGVRCSVASVVTVNPSAVAGTITGAPVICMVASAAYTDAATGGVWSSSNTSIATISSLGLVTGVAAGTATISYTVANSCNTAIATATVTINPLPISGTITGSSVVCATMGITLTDAASSGTWSSSSTGIAIVGSTGAVSGLSAGTTMISYSVTNTCGTSVASKPVTVNPMPVAGTILGSSGVCASSTDALTDPAGGGVWSCSATSVAIVGSTGTVTGVSAGTSNIFYTVTNSCGAAEVTKTVTVNPLPVAGTIGSTSSSVCTGTVLSLTETATGGVWTSSNPSVASIGYLTGVVTTIASGTTVLNYSVTNSCGIGIAHDTITVSPLPFAGSISGSGEVCVGSSITLTDTATGGVWSGSSFAAGLSGGIVTGIRPGVDTIKYTVTNGCGVAMAQQTIIINSLPLVEIVTGGGSYCSGSAGLHIGLSGSETGVFYQLLLGSVPLGIPVTGTGAGLDFGVEPGTGVYTVLATNATSECNNEMADSATIAVIPTTTPTISIAARPGLRLGVGESDTLTATVTGAGSAPTYQWYVNSAAVPGAVTNVFVRDSYFDGDSVSCEVMSSAVCGTSAAADAIIRLGAVGVNSVHAQQQFSVYPNPNNGVFTADLSSNTDEAVHIIVTNIVGEKVSELTTIANKATEIRLPGAAAGVYFVNASAASGSYVVKVVFSK